MSTKWCLRNSENGHQITNIVYLTPQNAGMLCTVKDNHLL